MRRGSRSRWTGAARSAVCGNAGLRLWESWASKIQDLIFLQGGEAHLGHPEWVAEGAQSPPFGLFK